jgi:hypothetical protein
MDSVEDGAGDGGAVGADHDIEVDLGVPGYGRVGDVVAVETDGFTSQACTSQMWSCARSNF